MRLRDRGKLAASGSMGTGTPPGTASSASIYATSVRQGDLEEFQIIAMCPEAKFLCATAEVVNNIW